MALVSEGGSHKLKGTKLDFIYWVTPSQEHEHSQKKGEKQEKWKIFHGFGGHTYNNEVCIIFLDAIASV